jgi:hypothetical protein
MFLFDHLSPARTMLFSIVPIAFFVANIRLCEKYFGLTSTAREKFDARYPTTHFSINFFRYLWPLISFAVPYLLLSLIYFSGFYWFIQEKIFMWPAVQGINISFAIFNLSHTTKLLSIFGLIFAVYIVESVFNVKKKGMLLFKLIALLICLQTFFIVSINNVMDKNTYIRIAIFGTLFLWVTYLKPQRSKKLFAKINLNYYLFIIAFLFMFFIPFDFPKYSVFPMNFYVAAILAVYSFKAGWKAAVIGGICGLNFFSAVWWVFCLPESTICKCKNCGSLTVSCRDKCPKCKKRLDYEVIDFFKRIKNNIRPSLIILIFSVIIIIGLFAFNWIIDNRYIPAHNDYDYVVNVVSPAGLSNIVILSNSKVIGTNKVYTGPTIDSDRLTYKFGGKKLSLMSKNYFGTNIFAYVTKDEYLEKAEKIIKKIYLYDYKISKIITNDIPSNDGEMIELARLIDTQAYINQSQNECYNYVFSNYWYAININQRKEKFNKFFKNSNYPDFLLCMMSKYAEPDWFKGSVSMPYLKITNYKLQKIYNEEQVKRFLFFANNLGLNKLNSEDLLVCASPLIRKICANYIARNRHSRFRNISSQGKNIFNILKAEKSALPYYRKFYKKVKDYKVSDYLKILIINPESYTSDDFKIIKYLLKVRKIDLNDALLFGLDRPEIFEYIKHEKSLKIYRSTYFGEFLPREFKSTNAFDVFCKLIPQAKNLDLFANAFSRIKNKDAINKTVKILSDYPCYFVYIAQSDAINRAEIMKRFANESQEYDISASVICNYPFPGAGEVLKSIRDKCSEENKLKIDGFLQDD